MAAPETIRPLGSSAHNQPARHAGWLDRDDAELFREAERGIDHAAIGRDDEDALACGYGRLVSDGLRWQRDEVERRILGGERQMALELEAHHLARIAGDRWQLDLFHRHGAAGQGQRRRARARRLRCRRMHRGSRPRR